MLENTFIYLYPLVTIMSIVGYLPQIKALITTRSNCADISLSSWYMWVVSSVISMGYGVFYLKDVMFCVTTGMCLLLNGVVIGMVLYRRYQWKHNQGHAASFVAAE